MGSVSRQTQGHLAMLLFSALVAGSFAFGSRVANEISPSALNAVRFWIAVCVIGAAALATTGLPRAAFRMPWRYLVLGGLMSFYFVMMFEGLKTAPPVSASAVFTLTPAISAVCGWFLLRQVTTPRMALALAIGAAGALWVIFRADLMALMAFEVGLGEKIFFLGCVSHALYTPVVRKLNHGEPAVVFAFGTLAAGAVLLTAMAWTELWAVDWVALPGRVWWVIVYLAVFASSGSFVLLQTASLRLPSAKVMAYTYLVPSWVICWELALGGAVPPLLVSGGVCLTILALLMLLRNDNPSAVG